MQFDHNPILVIISVLIAILGATATLILLGIGEQQREANYKLRIVSATIAFATGTWAMHFIGMLAFRLPIPLAYDPLITLISYMLALMGAMPAMLKMSKGYELPNRSFGTAGFLTLSICAMHYTGMASMRMSPPIHYHPDWFVVSVVVAFVASYLALIAMEYLQRQRSVSWWLFLATAILLGSAVSAMHYLAMAGCEIEDNGISLAAASSGSIDRQNLIYLVIGLTVLVLLILLLSTFRQNRIQVWKTLLIVGFSELMVMMLMPALLPGDHSLLIESLLDVSLLMLAVLPVAWRLHKTGNNLYFSRQEVEKSLEAQRAIAELLSLPIARLDMQEALDGAIKIIFNISWLKVVPKGAIFLNDADKQSLTMVVQHHMPDEIPRLCAKVEHGKCLCGRAALELELQHHSHVGSSHTIAYEDMAEHGHYIVPLATGQDLQGVLCLYVQVGHQFDTAEAALLKTLGATLSELIKTKKNLQDLMLAKMVFEHNLTCLMITDPELRILDINPVFSEVTGYSADEILGKTPAVLKSGRHDEAFYQEMWREIQNTDSWEGEIWNKRKDGQIYPEWLTINTVRDNNQRVQNYIAAFIDMSRLKSTEEHILQLAYYDSLTGLANRRLFYDRLEQAVIQAKRNRNKLALLFIDLDRFKEVNDSLGHDAGDKLLKNVACRLRASIRESDVLARLGGDEFVVMLKDMEQTPTDTFVEICKKIAHIILINLSEGHEYERYTCYASGSIGIVIYPDDAENVGDLIQRADTAMYQAKNAGRNTYCFFTPELCKNLETRLAIYHALRHAIERNELSLVYQPLVDIDDQSIIGAEVLLRWRNAELGEVSPAQFIPLAEETGLIISIGDWVVQQACKQLMQWKAQNIFGKRYLAINVSIYQLMHRDFADRLLSFCQQYNIPPRCLELEITESGLAQRPDDIASILNQLRKHSFGLAIDDFGTGYSSLGRLKSFNVDLLKIDRSFVNEMTSSNDDAAIVRAIIEMSNALGLKTLAEGVETEEQRDLLRRYGCDRGQGYLFGKPVPNADFRKLLMMRGNVPLSKSSRQAGGQYRIQ